MVAAMSRLEATAAAACITYVERTQLGKKPPLSQPSRELSGATMAIDPATRANLELTRTLAGERRGSLLDAIDCTVTAAGSRLLAQRLAAPLTDAEAIAHRLDAVAASGFAGAEAPGGSRPGPHHTRATGALHGAALVGALQPGHGGEGVKRARPKMWELACLRKRCEVRPRSWTPIQFLGCFL